MTANEFRYPSEASPHLISAERLGIRARDTRDLNRRLEEGFPYTSFEVLAGLLEVTPPELGKLLQVHPNALEHRRRTGKLALGESERILRLSLVLHVASELFDMDQRSAAAWLKSPNLALGGKSPLVMARTELGAIEVERLIRRVEHGVLF